VPGLGSLAAAMDMALYLYEGDSFNAALAAAALIPGGAMLAIGVGKGARALFNLARSGAKDLGAAVKASRVFRGLAGGARAVSRVVGSVRTRISRLIGKADDVGRDVGRLADDADAWRVPGSVPRTGYRVGGTAIDTRVFRSGEATLNGGTRNQRAFWKAWKSERPNTLSKDNLDLIENNLAPRVDEQWVKAFPEHAGFEDDVIVHHHLDCGAMAVPLPDSLHRPAERYGPLHANC